RALRHLHRRGAARRATRGPGYVARRDPQGDRRAVWQLASPSYRFRPSLKGESRQAVDPHQDSLRAAHQRVAQVAAPGHRGRDLAFEPPFQLLQVRVVQRRYLEPAEVVKPARPFGRERDLVGDFERAAQGLGGRVACGGPVRAQQHEVVRQRIVMRDDVPGRLARVLVEPGRPGAPQLEAKVEAERKARAHEADEITVRDQRDDLDAGYTVLQYDRERRVLRGGGQRRPG